MFRLITHAAHSLTTSGIPLRTRDPLTYKVFDVVVEDEGHAFVPLVGLLVLRSVLYIEHARYVQAQGGVRYYRTFDVIDIRLCVLLETQLPSDNCSPVTVNSLH